jgi:hypothetical protein
MEPSFQIIPIVGYGGIWSAWRRLWRRLIWRFAFRFGFGGCRD